MTVKFNEITKLRISLSVISSHLLIFFSIPESMRFVVNISIKYFGKKAFYGIFNILSGLSCVISNYPLPDIGGGAKVHSLDHAVKPQWFTITCNRF